MRIFLLFLLIIFTSLSFAQSDNCSSAVSITPTFTNCSFQAGSSANSTQSLPSCSGGGIADDDVWYSFVANSTNTTITVDPTAGYDAVIELFSGTCGSLISLQCQDVNGLNGSEVLVITTLIPGNTYYFRVYHYGIASGTSTFNVCIVGLAPPTNNLPCNAFALPTVSPSCNFDIYTNLGSTGSSVPTPTGCGGSSPFQGGYAGGDVWFSVVVPPSGQLDIHTLAVDFSDGAMALYSGPCSALTLVQCDDDGQPGDGILMPHIHQTGLTPGTTMYIRVWEYGNNANGQFGICVSSPDNDNCANSQQICDLNGYGGITSSAYTIDTPSNMCGIGDPLAPTPGCVFGTGYTGASPVQIDNNSWLTFTASATTATLFVQVNYCSNGNGMQMQIFSGTNCTNFIAVSTFLETTNSQTITATGLIPGNTYYIVVDGFAGDICSYTISATSGVQVVEAVTTKSALCIGESATLSALVTGTGSYTYNWSSTPIGITGSTSSITVTPSQNTLYTVDVTGLCGAVTSASVYVTAHTIPTTSISASDTIVCAGQPINLNGNPTGGTMPYTSTWSGTGQPFLNSTSSSTPVFNSSLFGAYSLNYLLTDTIGCQAQDSVTVLVNPLPTVNITGTDSICNGQSTTLTATGGGSYAWNTGGLTNSISVSPTSNTNYTVIVTDANTCVDSSAINVVVNTLPTINITGNNTICQGGITTLTASGGSTYVWNNGSTASSISVSPTADSTYLVTGTSANGCSDTSSILVQVVSNPTATISGIDTICLGNLTTLTASGGGTYLWDNSSTLSSINVSPTTTTIYSVLIDLGGCKDSTTQLVVVNPLPTVNITGVDSICNGQSTTLTVTGGGSYAWNTGSSANSISVSPTSSTNYSVVVTDVNTCVDSSAINVVVNTLPIASISGNTIICQGSSTSLMASGGSSYVWNTGSTTALINVSPTADSTFTVIATNGNGCADTTSILVQIVPNPTAIITGNDSICLGDATTLTASGGGTYSWNTGVTTPSITVSPTANSAYTVIVDVGGCMDTTNLNVIVNALPVINITGNTTICAGQSTTLTATGGGAYSWNIGGSLDSITVSPTINTSYTVTVTDANSCVNNSTATIFVNPLPNIDIIGNTPICLGTSTTLVASGGNTYVWNTSATTSSINVSPTTTSNYTVVGTDANGCIDSSQITVTVLSQPTASILGTNTVCFGESTILTASGGNTYLWSTFDTISTITVNPIDTTTYTVIVNSNGCLDSTNYTVDVTPLPNIIAYSDTTIILGQSANLFAQGVTPLNWSPTNGLSCTNCPNPIATPEETTTYCVSNSENGCFNSSCVTVYVDEICGDVFVPNSFSPNGDGMNDCLKVYSNCLQTVLFRVYSRWGELIYESDDVDGCWDGTNNGSDLNTGVYAFTVEATLISGEEILLKGNTTLFK